MFYRKADLKSFVTCQIMLRVFSKHLRLTVFLKSTIKTADQFIKLIKVNNKDAIKVNDKIYLKILHKLHKLLKCIWLNLAKGLFTKLNDWFVVKKYFLFCISN